MRVLISLVALLTVATAACGGDADIENVEWQLVSISGTEVPPDVVPTLLLANGTVAGLAGCNTFTGPYELSGDDLSFGQLATTRMACVPGIDEVEQAYVAALPEVSSAARDGDSLELSDADGNVLLAFETP